LLQFNRLGKVQTTTVPFRGGGESITAAVAGDVHGVFSDVVPALPLVREGRLRALAITAPKRSILAPDLPTLDEAGLTGFDGAGWTAAFAPANTPREIVERLNREINAALADPTILARFADVGAMPIVFTPAEATAFVTAQTEKWAKVIKGAGIKPE
jgi:tripartite-type tricarboxylate transporter receptor subunit TctC